MRSDYYESIVRGIIAFIVTYITWELTFRDLNVASQWEAVFLMVIAYYFKDRPQAEKHGDNVFQDERAARAVAAEMIAQFIIAMLLLLSTAALFSTILKTQLRDMIAGAWVGGVTLALTFYFKDVAPSATTTLHNTFRSILAITVGAATAFVFYSRLYLTNQQTTSPLPLQWVALAFIVITFYFKERGNVEPSATSKASSAAAATT